MKTNADLLLDTLLGVFATESRRTTELDAIQTPAGLSVPPTKAASSYTRMDFYLEQVVDVLRRLDRQPKAPAVTYWVGDGNYARKKIFDRLEAEGCHLIIRLCSDVRLHPPYTAPQRTGRGRKRQYGGQIQFEQIGPSERPESLSEPMEAVGALPDKPSVDLLTTKADCGDRQNLPPAETEGIEPSPKRQKLIWTCQLQSVASINSLYQVLVFSGDESRFWGKPSSHPVLIVTPSCKVQSFCPIDGRFRFWIRYQCAVANDEGSNLWAAGSSWQSTLETAFSCRLAVCLNVMKGRFWGVIFVSI